MMLMRNLPFTVNAGGRLGGWGSNLLQSPMSAATNVIHQDGESEYGSRKKDKKRERWLLHLPVPK